MFNIGPTELIVILVIALIVFGPKRLPEIGRTMGKSLRELRKATDDIKGTFSGSLDDIEDEWDDPPKIQPPSAEAAVTASAETEAEPASASVAAPTVTAEASPPAPTGPGAAAPSPNGSGPVPTPASGGGGAGDGADPTE